MCFYNDETPEFYNDDTRKARKGHRCEGCSRTILAGELYTCGSGKSDGCMYTLRICGACNLDMHRIHIHELAEGCRDYHSWCQPGDLWQTLPDYGMDRSSREDGQRFMQLAKRNGTRRLVPLSEYLEHPT